MNLMFLDARALQTRLRGAKDSPGLPVGPGHPGALLPAKIRLELLFAIRRFSSPRFKKFGRNMRGDVREMEFGLIPGRGKLPEIAQNPLGGVGRIDDDEGLQRFDRPRALGLLCRGAAAVPAGYGCERGMSGCCHGVAPPRVLPWPPCFTMVRLYCVAPPADGHSRLGPGTNAPLPRAKRSNKTEAGAQAKGCITEATHMPYQFLVDMYETECIKVVSVWSEFTDED